MKYTTLSNASKKERADDAMLEEIKRIVEALFSNYSSTSSHEVDVQRKLINPRGLASANHSEQSIQSNHSPQAKKAYNTLVSAHSTYITPVGQKWFSLKGREANNYAGSKTSKIDWYSKVTEICDSELAESNFYTVIQELFADRCLGGTGACFIGGGETEDLHFVHVPLGLFAIAEDHKGQVDTFARKFRLTAAQAAENWGEDKLGAQLADAYGDPSKRHTEKFTFIHLVRPRKASKKEAQDVPESQRPFEGIYVDELHYSLLHKEAYYEFPYFVTRFLKGNDSPYGVAPGVDVIPVIRQLMKLERLLDVQAEVAAYPRILQLASQNRQIDLRAGGITTVSKEEAQMGYPRELSTTARYDIGIDRIKAKEEIINAAFFVNMLNAISNIERQMTATEINAREAEKVLAFSPSFTLFITDFKAAFRRIIAILYRQGKLPQQGMPSELMQQDANGNVTILNPNVVYLGKIAQAIERVQRMGINDVLDRIIHYTQGTGDTSMLESLKPHLIARYLVESSGAPSDIMKNDREMEEMMMQKQAQAQAMMQAEQQAQDVNALAQLSRASTNSQNKGS